MWSVLHEHVNILLCIKARNEECAQLGKSVIVYANDKEQYQAVHKSRLIRAFVDKCLSIVPASAFAHYYLTVQIGLFAARFQRTLS